MRGKWWVRRTAFPIARQPVILVHPRQVFTKSGEVWEKMTTIYAARIEALFYAELSLTVNEDLLREGQQKLLGWPWTN